MRSSKKNTKNTKKNVLSALPKDIVAFILSLTSPRDVCRSAAISKGFKSVAYSDAAWDRFLRSDHRDVLSSKVSPAEYPTKMQNFFQIAGPHVGPHVLLDGGKVSFALDKASGEWCFTLKVWHLPIMGGSVPEYWKWIPLLQSRFSEVAKLVGVSWLYIVRRFSFTDKMEARLLSPQTTYVAYLVVNLKGSCAGFASPPLKPYARFVAEDEDEDEDEITNDVYLTLQPFAPDMREPDGRHPEQRMDNWMEIELGEIFHGQGDSSEVEIRLMEIDRLNWKSGIIIEGIELRPKVNSSTK